jgi:hypothetical protein
VTTVDAPEALSELLATAKERGYATTRVGYVEGQGVINVASPAGTLIYAWLLTDPTQCRVWFRPVRESVAHGYRSLIVATRLLMQDSAFPAAFKKGSPELARQREWHGFVFRGYSNEQNAAITHYIHTGERLPALP